MADDFLIMKLEGSRDCRAAFAELREHVKGNPFRKAVRAGAQLMLDELYTRVPVGKVATDKHAGQLVSSLRIALRKTRTTIRARIVVGAAAFYWRFLEYGTKHAAPHPFVTPAFESRRQEAAQEVINEFERGLDKAERRAKRLGGL